MARDFKEYVRLSGMTHVRTSPYYPQSNGKIESWHKTLKQECIRPKAPQSLEAALRAVQGFVDEYNNRRLHSALGYVTPADKLAGREDAIHRQRDERIELSRKLRQERRRAFGRPQNNKACGEILIQEMQVENFGSYGTAAND